jgi:hypothetical protein
VRRNVNGVVESWKALGPVKRTDECEGHTCDLMRLGTHSVQLSRGCSNKQHHKLMKASQNDLCVVANGSITWPCHPITVSRPVVPIP